MNANAPILVHAEPVGSRARDGTWRIGSADITARILLAEGCRTVPARIEMAPLDGLRAP